MKRALIVNATAGSGKTTTIVDGLGRVFGVKQLKYKPSDEQLAIWKWLKNELCSEDEVIVCAFSNAIATELKERLTFGTATTIHSLGCRIMRENGIRIGRPDTWKTANLYQQFCQVKNVKELSKAQRAILDDVRELVKYCKDAVLTEDDVTESSLAGLAIDNEYTFSSSASACELPVKYVLEEGSRLPVREARKASAFGKAKPVKGMEIDFDDMIYLPARYGWKIKADCIVVDEAQDLSAGKLQLIANQDCNTFVFVGDPNQAIFAFAGAQSDSFSKISEAMDEVEVLPLSYTYRCGKAIVVEAQKIVGDAINAGSTNPEGEIVYLDEADMDLQQGDMLVSRVNAPLMSLAWKLVKAGKPCQVVGRSIGTGLVKLINKLTDKQEVDSVTLCQLLEDWRDHQIKLLQTKKYDTESRQIAIGDQADCITTVATNCKTSTEVVSFIQQIFNDSDVKSIRLSSIHRAKGLEADNVYFFNPKNVPHVLAKTAEAKKQEWNLKFVAITRAIHKLVYVRIPEKEVEV